MSMFNEPLVGDRSDIPDLFRFLIDHPDCFPAVGDDDIEKEKLCPPSSQAAGEGGVAPADGAGGGGASASLTPAIWERTIPYDGETFHLEYMDLDEFLLENGIPVTVDPQEAGAAARRQAERRPEAVAVTTDDAGAVAAASAAGDAAAAAAPDDIVAAIATECAAAPEAPPPARPSPVSSEPGEALTAAAAIATPTPPATTLLPVKLEEEVGDEGADEEEDGDEEEEGVEEEDEEAPKEVAVRRRKSGRRAPGRDTPPPLDPEAIEVDIQFQPDPTDLVLSSVPGGELFNPRKHKFSDEELRPQPMIKKAKKVYVPDEQKDDKYWSRRKKNNVAAKRSRDARRLKENQITVRASFLERENAALRQQVAELRKDCGRCRSSVARYQAQYGPL